MSVDVCYCYIYADSDVAYLAETDGWLNDGCLITGVTWPMTHSCLGHMPESTTRSRAMADQTACWPYHRCNERWKPFCSLQSVCWRYTSLILTFDYRLLLLCHRRCTGLADDYWLLSCVSRTASNLDLSLQLARWSGYLIHVILSLWFRYSVYNRCEKLWFGKWCNCLSPALGCKITTFFPIFPTTLFQSKLILFWTEI